MNILFLGRLRAGLGAVGALSLLGGGLMLASAPVALAQSSNNVTLNLQTAPIQTVLRNLFKNAGKNFTIDPNVTGFVTVNVNQVPFDAALQAVLSGANPPLQAPTPADPNGIYRVQVAAPAAVAPTPANSGNGGGANAGDTPSTANDPHHAYRIPIAHYDAYYMSLLIAQFSRKGGPPIEVPSDPTGAKYGYTGLGSSGGGGGGIGGGGGRGGGGGGFGGGQGGGGFGGGGQGGFGGGGGGGFGGGGGGFGGIGGGGGGFGGF